MPLHQIRIAWSKLRHKRSWSRYDLAQVIQRFRTPAAINVYMQTCIEYVHDHVQHDVEEHWQLPERTVSSLKGDCEDYSLLAQHVLRHHGYEARILSVFTKTDGHALCVFREGNSYHTICNEGLHRLDLRTHDEAELARLVAMSVYPTSWTLCSYADALHPYRAPDDSTNFYVPHYVWIEP